MPTHDVKITHDVEANAGYVYVRQPEPVARTVAVSSWINVDLAADGRIVGIETLCGQVDVVDLALVLFELRWPDAH